MAKCNLILFVTPQTQHVASTVRKLMPPGADLSVIDVCQHPEEAEKENVIAVPTLVRKAPLPRESFIGMVSDTSALEAFLRLCS
ncbi:MAG: circadian clock KaiB family protein [Candidatus Obscuribacterales bacterium]